MSHLDERTHRKWREPPCGLKAMGAPTKGGMTIGKSYWMVSPSIDVMVQ